MASMPSSVVQKWEAVLNRQLFAVAVALLFSSPAWAGSFVPTPVASPVPTQVKHVSPTIGTASRVSPGVTQALSGKAQGEYRVTSTLSVTWDGTKITASTRYVGTKVIREVFDQP